MMMTEAEFGKKWRAMARREGHTAKLPAFKGVSPKPEIGPRAVELLRRSAARGGVRSTSALGRALGVGSSSLSTISAQLTVRGLMAKTKRSDGAVFLRITKAGREYLDGLAAE